MKFSFSLFFTLLCSIFINIQSIEKVETRREKKAVDEAINKLPKTVQKSIKDMHAQGVPKEVIAEKIKMSAKNAPAARVVDGVLKEDPWKSDRAVKEAKKRQAKLKNEIRNKNKNDRKNKFRREL